MPASDHHPEYDANLPLWQTVRACVAGSSAIKAGRTKYLPKPSPEDDSHENSLRYDDYLMRANFVNFTGSTVDGMLGMAFRKDPEIMLQAEIEYLVENANGAGLSLEQMAKGAVSDTLQTGRYGFLTDYPAAPEGLSSAEVTALQLRANIKPYRPESIPNWDTEIIGAVERLSSVSLIEDHKSYSPDGFSYSIKKYTRVLSIIDGLYVQMLYDDDDNVIEYMEPRNSSGARWNYIPFEFAGSINNNPKPDKAPTYDIAEINLAHFRNSADFEDSSYMVGQPWPIFTGVNQTTADRINKSGVRMGSRAPAVLNEGADAKLLQPSDNTMPERGMELKEKQIVKLGGRIIQDSSGTETAEAAKIRFAGQNANLYTVVSNVEAAIERSLEHVMKFMGGTGDNIFELNKSFYDKTVDPQLIMARIALLDRGVIAQSDLQDKLREEGEIDGERTNEEIDGEAESADVML
jgi:hypothetical protein